ncbi:oxygen-independent coproporphyrinogen III oxidase [Aureimonas endophytica]|uniref:Coproporphyrinogen-III oxidase n=1 Tax=Aureimonas endophytica TaxID=2027858 RepID=A0A916ZLN1_9HYPH|nr:oxygen-independent coproporphyrinogen III oxidase [Aureimonas endophytica]GGE03475.1 oxygen-independent coproporphyrinogen III oxidase [Aureimonas endophytica]
MTLARHLAAARVPRYTSYPTAADFTSAVGPEQAARWLGDVASDEPVSAYIHIPYCRDICHYCGCHAKAARRESVIDAFRSTLLAEIALAARHLRDRVAIGRINWGGGTPSILGLDGLASVLSELRDNFDLGALAEHAIELDPRLVDPGFALGLAALGVTRASLGVQDLDPVVQEAIGRFQPQRQVQRAVDVLRAAGIGRLNFDLVYGLPHQTEASLQRTLESVLAMAPDRIAFYGYAHLPSRRANQRLIDESALPGPEARLAQASTIARSLEKAGFERIGIDHFARPDDPLAVAVRQGRLRRNFQGYTDDPNDVLIGFGPSAISKLPGGFAQNASDIGHWRAEVTAGRLATRRGHGFSGDDRNRARVIERLMCTFSTELEETHHRFADELALLRPFAREGLIELEGGHLKLTENGRPFVRLVAAVFDRFRTEAEQAFSEAV